jgi:hypothetical protein
MKHRKLFDEIIVKTDRFVELPPSAQVLYFYWSLNADDEGLVTSPKKIMRMIGASVDDARLLIAKKFVCTVGGKEEWHKKECSILRLLIATDF